MLHAIRNVTSCLFENRYVRERTKTSCRNLPDRGHVGLAGSHAHAPSSGFGSRNLIPGKKE